jgi:Ca2+/Na+ antiporter
MLLNLLELFQVVTSINSVFLGLTLLAFGNSIGGINIKFKIDYFSIVAFAKQGKGMTSIAGVYSGQLFNLLFGLGISMLLRSIKKGYSNYKKFR